ncbi:MAG: MarR family winged helix-turn-helix transcriptional regulator [Janthinobacterium lividum]
MPLAEIPTLAAEVPRTKRAPLPASLSVWTGYLLGRATDQSREYFEALVKPLGIGRRHFSVLAVLGEEKPLSQVEMSERLGIDRNTMVLLLDDLEGKALVTRRRDPSDRRAHLVTLTDAGRDTLAKSIEAARRTNDEVFAPLSPEERTLLHSLLSRLF